MFQLPPPQQRPLLATVLFEHGVDYGQAAKALGCSRETVRLICLPFADPRRRVPNPRLMTRIRLLTSDQVRPADFYEAMPQPLAAA